MSYDIFVYANYQSLPSPASWKLAILDAGFPAELDTDFEIGSITGFLPCPINGEVSGFELYSETTRESDLSKHCLAADLNFRLQFNIGSRPLELLSAAAAASSLANMSGGVMVDAQTNQKLAGPVAIEWAKKLFSAQTETKVTSRPEAPASKKPWWRSW